MIEGCIIEGEGHFVATNGVNNRPIQRSMISFLVVVGLLTVVFSWRISCGFQLPIHVLATENKFLHEKSTVLLDPFLIHVMQMY